ncbi:MAG TPA: hypothetical protein VM282_09720 [Acidimicrobiales bacterium]|nr:hypothetical protein [Acidimicrobiales bacterium]
MIDRVDPSASPNRSSLDAVVRQLLCSSPFRYSVAENAAEREIAFRLRYRALVEQGWRAPADDVIEVEEDEYDARAIHVVGWDDITPIATGRIVLPPGLLPTEAASPSSSSRRVRLPMSVAWSSFDRIRTVNMARSSGCWRASIQRCLATATRSAAA